MSDPTTLNEFEAQLVIAGLVAYALEFIKRAEWFPWLTADTRTANRLVAAAVALVAAVGVHFNYDASQGVLTISGLTMSSLRHGLWEYGKQLVFQQGWYDAVVAKGRDVTADVPRAGSEGGGR